MRKLLKGDVLTSPPKARILWAAIRWCADNYHWIDTGTLGSRDFAESKAQEWDKKIPDWAKANPVIGYKQVIITLAPEE